MSCLSGVVVLFVVRVSWRIVLSLYAEFVDEVFRVVVLSECFV